MSAEFDPPGRKIRLVIEEVDLLRPGENHNLADDDLWERVALALSQGCYDVMIFTPPCNTHSRLRHRRDGGPGPLRDLQHPKGFPWLEGQHKEEVELANLLIERCQEAIFYGTSSVAKTLWLMEHPVDLGRTDDRDPASFWPEGQSWFVPAAEGRPPW